MNPQNETTLFAGNAIISDCPKRKEIGTRPDHFWVEINGQVFDNSGGLEKYSYTDLKPGMKCCDVLSGNFQFESVA